MKCVGVGMCVCVCVLNPTCIDYCILFTIMLKKFFNMSCSFDNT